MLLVSSAAAVTWMDFRCPQDRSFASWGWVVDVFDEQNFNLPSEHTGMGKPHLLLGHCCFAAASPYPAGLSKVLAARQQRLARCFTPLHGGVWVVLKFD